jgi:hypothetical protein
MIACEPCGRLAPEVRRAERPPRRDGALRAATGAELRLVNDGDVG